MLGSPRSVWRRYGLSALLCIGACSFTAGSIGDGPPRPLLYFTLAAVLSAWFGGFGPGLLVTFVGAASSLAFFRVSGLPALPEADENSRVLVFLLLCIPLCWLIDRYLIARAVAAETGKELRANEARYRKIVDTAEEGILTLDPLGQIDYANPRLCRMLGWSLEDLRGRSMHVCLFVEDYSRVEWDLEQLLKGEMRQFEIRLRTSADGAVWTRVSASPLSGDSVVPTGSLWMVTDLTAQKQQEAERTLLLAREQSARSQAEAATRRLAFLAEATTLLSSSLDYSVTLQQIADLVVPELADWCVVDVIDEEGNIRRLAVAHADSEAREDLRLLKEYAPCWDREEGVASVLREGVPKLHTRVSDDVLLRIAQDERHGSLLRRLGLGSMVSVPLIARSRILGALTLVFGHSERSYGLEDLAFAEELAGRAGLALDNARHYRDAHEGSQRKDEFLAVLAHELRSPLAAIANAAYLLGHREGEGPKLGRLQEIIERQAQHLARLVEDLLDVSRIAQGKVHLCMQRTDLGLIVQRAAETVRPLINTRSHAFILEVPDENVWVNGDPIRLTQIFSNLITNAAKYTEPGGNIRVSLELEGQEMPSGPPQSSAVVRVRDDGVGLPPELQAQVFQPFIQAARAPGRELGGLGIGLALVQHLVELHGGTVAVTSEGEGRGCEFVVQLPLLEQAAKAPASSDGFPSAEAGAQMRMPNAGGIRVLVVEDNTDAAETLVEVLVHWGAEAQQVSTGAAALRVAAEWRPDFVILDLGLPDINGCEVAQRLKSASPAGVAEGDRGDQLGAERKTTAQTRPIMIALTGQGSAEDRRRAEEAGFTAFLLKPAAPEELMALLFSGGRRTAA